MGLHKVKSFLGILVLLAYLSMGVFSLLQFSHSSAMPMANCPYALNGFSICENGLRHINDWHQFSNVTPTTIFFLFFLFALWIILYFFGKQKLLNQRQYFYRWKYYLGNKKFDTYSHRIIKWLSLFENSPSFSYAKV